MFRVRFSVGERVGRWLHVTLDELRFYRKVFHDAGVAVKEELQ